MSEKTITITASEYNDIQAVLNELGRLAQSTEQVIAENEEANKRIREELAENQAEVEHAKRVLNL